MYFKILLIGCRLSSAMTTLNRCLRESPVLISLNWCTTFRARSATYNPPSQAVKYALLPITLSPNNGLCRNDVEENRRWFFTRQPGGDGDTLAELIDL